jgi:hypothetical protein
MRRGQGRFQQSRTIVTESAAPVAWVVLVGEADLDTMPVGVAADLARNAMSVLEVVLDRRAPKAAALEAVRRAATDLDARAGSLPVLFAGIGRMAPLAAAVAAELEAPGLLSVDGSLLSVAWRGPAWSSPTLLLSTSGAGVSTRWGQRAGSLAIGRQGQVAPGRLGTPVADQRLREWRRAADAGRWPTRPGSVARRLAAPAAAAMALSGGAALLAATPVSAAQRQGDGVGSSTPVRAERATLGGTKVGRAQRQGDHVVPHATGSKALIDAAGFKWFVNTDITFQTSSSASGAMSEASYTHSVTASTLHGGGTQERLNDAYDGYNALFVSVNGTTCTTLSVAGCTSYNGNGPAVLSDNGREVDTPVQVIDGLNVSRRIYVPTDDHFERTLNVFNNPGTTPVTVTMTTSNNLGSDANTVITGTSAGGTTPADSDEWVTTFQNWTGTTTTDPRLGHVLQTTGAAVPAAGVTFTNGSDRPTWHYTFTVGAGQTVLIGNFAVADATIAASQADSARLAALPPTAVEGMSATDLSELGNFGTKPTVTTQPTDQTAGLGGAATFSTAATAAGLDQTPTVQWQVSTDGGATFSNLAGQTSDTLHLSNLASSANGQQYRAVFSNGIGSSVSKPATLTVATGGYWTAASDGGVFAFGNAPYLGSQGGAPLNAPVVGIAATPDAHGYWLVASDGGIFAYGDAGFHGSHGGQPLNAPIVGLAPTPDGNGYWLVASDGGIFAYGDAGFYGSQGGQPLNAPIVGITPTPDGKGYWLVASDGGIFAYGDAGFHGSQGGQPLNAPVVGIAASHDGNGYWLVASDGGVFAYGDAGYHGSAASLALFKPIVGISASPDGNGYRLVAADGGVFAYGDALFDGSTGGQTLNAPVIGLANG